METVLPALAAGRSNREWVESVRQISAVFASMADVHASDVSLNETRGTRYYVNSEGFKSGTHKLLVTRVDGTIQAGATTYSIANNYDVFYFVRGDAAHGLDESQPGDQQHWYLYRWVDETVPSSAMGAQSEAVTWGRLKGTYR